MPWGSNVECRKGYAYGPKNLNNGKCRFNFQGEIWNKLKNSVYARYTQDTRGAS